MELLKKKLSKYTWGFGIEHEMHLFHHPQKNSKKNIKDFIIFDSDKAIKRIKESYNIGKIKLSNNDIKFINSVPFETSGRLCNEKWVIKRVPVKMPEFVTWKPFCSIKDNRSIRNMTLDIKKLRETYLKILMKDNITKKLIEKYGKLSQYPFGMTRYLKVPIIKNEKPTIYNFQKKSDGTDVVIPEYNGSYHITMTLPYTENILKKDFIDMHKNFCNQLQWLEPLLLTTYFTGDEYAPGSNKKRARGSYRVMIIGWGNFAGTDIRLLDTGIGRYAKTPTYWRDNFKLYESEKLDPCIPPSASALAEKAITTLSSDIRTFGSTDPSRPEHRESGIGMTVPNGIEFRIFDHFQDQYINHLCILMSRVAENSRVVKTEGYVYKNKAWINAMQNIMTHGYKAELNKDYIQLLREKLGLKINTKSIIAYDVFQTLYYELYEKNKKGKWNLIFNNLENLDYNNNRIGIKEDIFPEVNKKGWQFAFMMKANRNMSIMKRFNLLSKYFNSIKEINFEDFKKVFIKIFGKNWINDVVDMLYFYKTIMTTKKIVLEKNINGTIKNIKILKKIPYFDNFNKVIIEFFSEDDNVFND